MHPLHSYNISFVKLAYCSPTVAPSVLSESSSIIRGKQQAGLSFNIDDVRAEEQEEGDTDSVVGSDEMEELSKGYDAALKDKLLVIVKEEDDIKECTSDQLDNWVLNKGLDDDLNWSKVLAEWKASAHNVANQQPEFDSVDNPGKWPEYSFRPNPRGKYQYHRLPAGVIPVPKNEEGTREVDGWKFHYQGWKGSKNIWRDGANSANPYPENRKGRLDYDLLKKMGLTKQRIVQGDALFFKQLLQPMFNP